MLNRPDYHLDRLSPTTRWEATRRHPLYMQLWEFYRSAASAEDEDLWSDLRRTPEIIDIYSCLRVTGDPVDPSVELERDDQHNIPGLFQSSIQPISVRQLAGVLAQILPPELLRLVADTFNTMADGKDGNIAPNEALEAMSDLLLAENDQLDRLLDAPFYRISPVAPRDSWIAEIAAVQTEWRKRLGLETQRDHSSKHTDYFRIWDMREGWCEGSYRRADARELRSIASSLRVSESTARSRYQRAFQLISGHEFTPENWFKLMGVQQLAELFGTDASRVLTRRSIRNPQRRETDSTTLSQGRHSAPDARVEHPSRRVDGLSGTEIASQIQRLINDGRKASEIMDELQLERSALPAIRELRKRSDLLSGVTGE